MTLREAAAIQDGDRVMSRGRTGTVTDAGKAFGGGWCFGVDWDGAEGYLKHSFYNTDHFPKYSGLRRLHRVK